MKRWKYAVIALVSGLLTLGVWLGTASIARSDSADITLSPGFSPDPLISTGVSGGAQATPDCGYINAAPNHIVTLTDTFPFLQAKVMSNGDVTLLIEAPTGKRICSDDVDGLMPQISGAPAAGSYKIWIGDYLTQPESGYDYELSLSQTKVEK